MYRWVNIYQCEIRDLSPLAQIPSLQSITISGGAETLGGAEDQFLQAGQARQRGEVAHSRIHSGLWWTSPPWPSSRGWNG